MPQPRMHLRKLAHRPVHQETCLHGRGIAAQFPCVLVGIEGAAVIARPVVAQADVGVERRVPVRLRVERDETEQRLGEVGIVAARRGFRGRVVETRERNVEILVLLFRHGAGRDERFLQPRHDAHRRRRGHRHLCRCFGERGFVACFVGRGERRGNLPALNL
jgi:hypothetical protein